MGLATILRHRMSEALDFFINAPFDAACIAAELRDLDLSGRQGATSASTLYWYTEGDEAQKASFIAAQGRSSLVHEAALMDRTASVASLRDIAAMKSIAIIGRIEKKDYIDMAAILSIGRLSLGDILAFNAIKYAGSAYSEDTLVRSLVYFVDVDPLPLPIMTSPLTWNEAKRVITAAVRAMGTS